MCPLSSDLYPPSFIFFFSSRTFQQPHLLHIRERERAGSDRQKDKGDAPAPIVHAALPNLIGVHHVALPHLLPHRHSSSSPPLDWVRSACSSYLFIYFHICLFWFNFIVRIGFCFVFCVCLCETFFESEAKRQKQRSDVFWSQQLCFFFFCFSVSFFFFFNLDSKETMRSGLITVLKTVQVNYGSNSSLLFWHRSVLKLKRTMIVRDSRFS